MEVSGDGDGVGDLFLGESGGAGAAFALIVFAVEEFFDGVEEAFVRMFGFGAAFEVFDRFA